MEKELGVATDHKLNRRQQLERLKVLGYITKSIFSDTCEVLILFYSELVISYLENYVQFGTF